MFQKDMIESRSNQLSIAKHFTFHGGHTVYGLCTNLPERVPVSYCDHRSIDNAQVMSEENQRANVVKT